MRFSVVFEVAPRTADFDEEWTLVDANVPRRLREPAARRDPHGWVWEVFCDALPDSLWDEADVPAEVRAGGKFVALVEGQTHRSHGACADDVDAFVEVIGCRRIS